MQKFFLLANFNTHSHFKLVLFLFNKTMKVSLQFDKNPVNHKFCTVEHSQYMVLCISLYFRPNVTMTSQTDQPTPPVIISNDNAIEATAIEDAVSSCYCKTAVHRYTTVVGIGSYVEH